MALVEYVKIIRKRISTETPHADEAAKPREHTSTTGGSAKMYNLFRNQLSDFSENWKEFYLKNHLYTPAHIVKMCSIIPYTRHLFNYVRSSFIHNSQKLETT